MNVIFDLDQTLVNTNSLEAMRARREWGAIHALIEKGNVQPFDGINALIKRMETNGMKYIIVTSSPRSYCERIVKYFHWSPLKLVCYYDTELRKPHPDPILKALEYFDRDSQVVSLGDQENDIIASNTAGVTS